MLLPLFFNIFVFNEGVEVFYLENRSSTCQKINTGNKDVCNWKA